MAVTVDDLPVGPPRAHTVEQQEAITRGLLAALARHGVPATGFVNQERLLDGGAVEPRRVALLGRWLDAGHELGNHGHSHLDLHRVGVEEWLDDVGRGEGVLRPLLAARGLPLRWFRHPFLHTGRSAEVQAAAEGFLHRRGYRIAPVTMDNGEWIYGGAYAAAWNRGDEALMRRLGDDYVRYMLEVTAYWEGQAEAILGRQPAQVLLVHAYALNADRLGELLARLAERGYRWVPLGVALEDPAYALPAGGHTGPGGISWLHRWAITRGVDPAVFRGEPTVPGWVEALPDARP
jgi:peptidoglycan/xylan/chitin deacetylase (PgdA/CDA1 family)